MGSSTSPTTGSSARPSGGAERTAALDPQVLDRAHYAGVTALVDCPTAMPESGPPTRWPTPARLGIGPERIPDAVAELDKAFRVEGVWSRLVPGSLDGLRALHDTGVVLAIVSNSDGTLEGRLAREGICQAGPGRACRWRS